MCALLHVRLAATAPTSTSALPQPSACRPAFNLCLAASAAHHHAFSVRLAASAATSACALPPPSACPSAFNVRLAAAKRPPLHLQPAPCLSLLRHLTYAN
jgi:hypothetical protein